MKFYNLLKIVSIVFILFVLAGCSINRTIYVNMDESLNKQSVEVDFLGTSNKQSEKLDDCSYMKYWGFNDFKEQFTIKKINYLPDNSRKEQIILSNDKIWTKWDDSECDYLYILADLPLINFDNEINWKRKLRMERYSWYNFWSDRDLHISINKSGIKVIKNN